MARWLLVFLTFALTAQFVWAAVATYCGHETAPTSFHIGHHVHQHRAGPVESGHQEGEGDMSSGSLASEHVDCSYCHVSVAQVGSVQGASFGTFHSLPFAGMLFKPLISTLEADIERPKWARAD